MSNILFFAISALVFVSIPFVIGPVAVYFIQKMPRRRVFIPVPDQEVLSCTSPGFAARVQAISDLGFTRVVNLHSPDGMTKIFMTLMRNDATQDLANVTEMVASVSSTGPVTRVSYCEFSTEFSDGFELDTNNSDQPLVFDDRPQKQINKLPGMEPEMMYTIHRNFVNGVNATPKTLPVHGTESEYIQEGMIKDLERQRTAGYLQFDSATENYSPTVFGAVIMTWRLAWPVGMIRRKQLKQNAKHLASQFNNATGPQDRSV